MKRLIVFLALATGATPQNGYHLDHENAKAVPKRLFIEQRTLDYTNEIGVTRAQRNVTLELTREIVKKCSALVTVTEKAQTADFDLRISPGSSTLYANGDVVATFSARFRVANLAKDTCDWIAKH